MVCVLFNNNNYKIIIFNVPLGLIRRAAIERSRVTRNGTSTKRSVRNIPHMPSPECTTSDCVQPDAVYRKRSVATSGHISQVGTSGMFAYGIVSSLMCISEQLGKVNLPRHLLKCRSLTSTRCATRSHSGTGPLLFACTSDCSQSSLSKKYYPQVGVF